MTNTQKIFVRDVVVEASPCTTCKAKAGAKCQRTLITGKVCRWKRIEKVDYYHAARKKLARENQRCLNPYCFGEYCDAVHAGPMPPKKGKKNSPKKNGPSF